MVSEGIMLLPGRLGIPEGRTVSSLVGGTCGQVVSPIGWWPPVSKTGCVSRQMVYLLKAALGPFHKLGAHWCCGIAPIEAWAPEDRPVFSLRLRAPEERAGSFPRSEPIFPIRQGVQFLLPLPAQAQPFLLEGIHIGWDQPCWLG